MRTRFIQISWQLSCIALAAASLWGLSGCAPAAKSRETSAVNPAAFVRESAVSNQPALEDNPGSLFSSAQADFLVSDNRARKVGDVVLVEIVENSKGAQKADTTTNRKSDINLGVEAFFDQGHSGVIPWGRTKGLSAKVGPNPMVKAGATSDFDGKGETKREGALSATVAARVIQVMPGPILQVEGAREIRVNNENQIVVVRGLVRPRDIKGDNTVPSTYLADARIEYFGQGVLGDKQKPGWATRVLDNVWPF